MWGDDPHDTRHSSPAGKRVVFWLAFVLIASLVVRILSTFADTCGACGMSSSVILIMCWTSNAGSCALPRFLPSRHLTSWNAGRLVRFQFASTTVGLAGLPSTQ
jgi:hypothetical protein